MKSSYLKGVIQQFPLGIIILYLCFFSPMSNALESSTQNQEQSLGFSFYVQGDSISFWGDKIDLINGTQNFKDGVNIPRARFHMFGKKWDWYYYFVFDAAEERFRDFFVRYEEYEQFRITIGQYKVPYSLRFATSQAEMSYLEQALPSLAFLPGFRLGLETQFFPDPFTFTIGVVAPEVSSEIRGIPVEGDMPLAYHSRITCSPWHTEKEALHFGAAFILQESDSTNSFQFQSFPEVQTYNNHFLVDTGFIPECKNYFGQEYEAAALMRSFFIEGEYYHNSVHRYLHDLNFEGFFIGADYFLTGEHHVYNFKEGSLRAISGINHDYGAWQLALRCSRVDLQNVEITGGKETNLTFGLNWYVNPHVKFLFEYISAAAKPSANGLNRHLNIVGLRCQISTR